MTERTFVIVKPDAVAAGLVGDILGRYERAGLRLVALQQRTIDDAFADRHYHEHVAKSFYPTLREFMTSGPLIAGVLAGPDAVAIARQVNGATDPAQAEPGTIRADHGTSVTINCVHASDAPQTAASEIALWFPNLA
ncbi:MAG: nucleoside-diphosphate kinase [Propionibacterium sp.]|nr:MAG: nucleoside-diphosphate kinase [Propionibacterium sp.]